MIKYNAIKAVLKFHSPVTDEDIQKLGMVFYDVHFNTEDNTIMVLYLFDRTFSTEDQSESVIKFIESFSDRAEIKIVCKWKP
jgi:protein-tyrosine phosphatase